jgi:hypothetical protein
LERTPEKMTDRMYQHGEEVEWMETEIGNMKHGFNDVVQECQEIANMIIDTLIDNVQDRLKATKDALALVT